MLLKLALHYHCMAYTAFEMFLAFAVIFQTVLCPFMCQSYCDQQVLGCLVVVSSAVGLHRRMLIMRTKLDWYLLWRVLLYKICFEQYIFCEINGISLFKKGNFGICRSMRDGDLIADPYEYFDIILIISFFCC